MTVFGFELPAHPDFLLDPTLIGEDNEQRLAEHHRRMVHLVAGLWSEGFHYVLRYEGQPPREATKSVGGTRVRLLVRGPDEEATAQRRSTLEPLLWNLGFTPVRLEDASEIEKGLRAPPRGWEVHQEVRYAMMAGRREVPPQLPPPIIRSSPTSPPPPTTGGAHSAGGGGGAAGAAALPAGKTRFGIAAWANDRSARAATAQLPSSQSPGQAGAAGQAGQPNRVLQVFPWAGPGGTMQSVFTLLSTQPRPMTLRIDLAPVTIDDEERMLLSESARTTEDESHYVTRPQQLGTAQTLPSQNRSDPALAEAAAGFRAMSRRLDRPFCVRAVVHGDDHAAARQLADTLASVVREESAPADAAGPGTDGRPRAAVTELISPEPWSNAALLGVRVRRWAYYADARAAAVLFRFPVATGAGLSGIRVRQVPPFLRTGQIQPHCPPDHIILGRQPDGGLLTQPTARLSGHLMIAGITRAGKTSTLFYLLWQLLKQGIGLLVFESAKSDYRRLKNVPEFRDAGLRIYTPGQDAVAPLRVNIFEPVPGVQIQRQIDALRLTLVVSVSQVGPMVSIVDEALPRVYRRCGWEPSFLAPEREDLCGRTYPTMTDFVEELGLVIKERKYEGEVLANVTAAVTGRFGPLTRKVGGARANLFDVPLSQPSAVELFSYPTILEANALHEDDAALLNLVLLELLRQYREQTRDQVTSLKKLLHIIVIEEAHRILGEVASSGGAEGAAADVKHKSVQRTTQTIVEVGGYGEGVIVSDQGLYTVARQCRSNTNTLIGMNLHDPEDRQIVGDISLLNDRETTHVGRLEPGEACVFMPGLQRGTFVKVPYFGAAEPAEVESGKGAGIDKFVSDADVSTYMRQYLSEPPTPSLPFGSLCGRCDRRCGGDQRTYRMDITPAIQSAGLSGRALPVLNACNIGGGKPSALDDARQRLRKMAEVAVSKAGLPPGAQANWCAFLHLYHLRPPEPAQLKWFDDLGAAAAATPLRPGHSGSAP